MDVGLNNRNILGKENPTFADVVFMVEANHNEQYELWKDWSKESTTNVPSLDKEVLDNLAEAIKSWPMFGRILEMNNKVKQNEHTRVDWQSISKGFMLTIGYVAHAANGKCRLPVCVEFFFAMINGKKICFYNNCSRAGDSKLVEAWLIKRFQLTHDGYTRWNHVDATNFHNCITGLERLDTKPRNTKYKSK